MALILATTKRQGIDIPSVSATSAHITARRALGVWFCCRQELCRRLKSEKSKGSTDTLGDSYGRGEGKRRGIRLFLPCSCSLSVDPEAFPLLWALSRQGLYLLAHENILNSDKPCRRYKGFFAARRTIAHHNSSISPWTLIEWEKT